MLTYNRVFYWRSQLGSFSPPGIRNWGLFPPDANSVVFLKPQSGVFFVDFFSIFRNRRNSHQTCKCDLRWSDMVPRFPISKVVQIRTGPDFFGTGPVRSGPVLPGPKISNGPVRTGPGPIPVLIFPFPVLLFQTGRQLQCSVPRFRLVCRV